LELTYARRGIGFFFSARDFVGVGFANISTSFVLKIARFDAPPPLFIAVSVGTCDVSMNGALSLTVRP
jgi:hypothetical protein